MVGSFQELVERAQSMGPRPLVVAAAQEEEVLLAVAEARDRGVAFPFLVGEPEQIEQKAEETGVSLEDTEILEAFGPQEAAHRAVQEVRERERAVLMKGLLSTSTLLRAVLDREKGLRSGRTLSHVAVFSAPGYQRLFFLTDAALNIAPDLERKVDIIKNAAELAHKLGVDTPGATLVCAVETVNPDMPATLEAAALTQMEERGQLGAVQVDGPLALDNAVSPRAAEIKGLSGPVAGRADILLVPNIEVGNVLYKCLQSFCPEAELAAVVTGAMAPVVLTSRADSHQTKLFSITLGIVAS